MEYIFHNLFWGDDFMDSEQRKKIIEKYLESYNSFHIEQMIKLLDKEIVFRNYSNGELTAETKGIDEFRTLAEKSAKVFSNRHQTMIDYQEIDDRVKIQIEYEATLAMDLPNGLNRGDKLQLKGTSIFRFHDGKLLLIEDFS
ncbi:nuclear transport factor 2 family protein [Metabacillus niabensis]|uniref:SnoaL-like domain-containing protein n=2 Tax=Metabacillus niabensis TaxID=324854 RepID=A0ABT9Z0A7_9BACI|nr:nuclear transport factor 2 family protein [Metabacillus niabensis]MDQ0225684.1 hypothetical protein [Metabacillus niabensis]